MHSPYMTSSKHPLKTELKSGMSQSTMSQQQPISQKSGVKSHKHTFGVRLVLAVVSTGGGTVSMTGSVVASDDGARSVVTVETPS